MSESDHPYTTHTQHARARTHAPRSMSMSDHTYTTHTQHARAYTRVSVYVDVGSHIHITRARAGGCSHTSTRRPARPWPACSPGGRAGRRCGCVTPTTTGPSTRPRELAGPTRAGPGRARRRAPRPRRCVMRPGVGWGLGGGGGGVGRGDVCECVRGVAEVKKVRRLGSVRRAGRPARGLLTPLRGAAGVDNWEAAIPWGRGGERSWP